MGVAVDWSRRGEYIAKHDVTPAQADEAHDDPSRVIIDPDYNTKSGESIRTIGFSSSKAAVVTVISYIEDDIEYGASAWKSNSRDRRYYQQGGLDEPERS